MGKIISLFLTILLCGGLCGCTSIGTGENVQISTGEILPECTSAENDVSFNLSKSKYMGTTIKVSADKPYWGMLVTNNGSSEIRVDVGANTDIVLIKPEQSIWIYCEAFFKEGSYQIAFSSKDTMEMNGMVKVWLATDKKLVIPAP